MRAFVAVAAVLALAPGARAAPGLRCDARVALGARTPVLLVNGTGGTGGELHALMAPELARSGVAARWVDLPRYGLGDLQDSVGRLAAGVRALARRAGRPIALYGVSQGALLARAALTMWLALRRDVDDVVAVAGPQHGTAAPAFAVCGPCAAALWQQRRGSAFLRALAGRGRAEAPGPTAWTTIRSSADSVIVPSSSATLRGASNVLIQRICPGRRTSHLDIAADPVSAAVLADALAHRGPARAARLPRSACAREPARGPLDAELAAASARVTAAPTLLAEPPVRPWLRGS